MGSKRILIVEDELIVSASIKLTLAKKGYNCSTVVSGEDAIEKINIYNPDLMLMDIGLDGKLDGISTAGIIRQQSAVPIVFITEQANSRVFQQAIGTRPQNYITKPFTDDKLLYAVESALLHSVLQHPSNPSPPLGERVSEGIFVFTGQEYKKVLFEDTLYLEANGMYTIMYCIAKPCYKISLSSNNVVAKLACPGIVKVSRSYHVNIHRIDSIKNDELYFGEVSIPVSKSYKADVLSRINKLSQK